MRLVSFSYADAFLRAAEPVLLKEEARCALMLGICLRMREGRTIGDGPPLFACVQKGETARLLAVRTPPHNLLVHASGDPAESGGFLAEHLAEAGERFPGVHGVSETAARFAEAWTSASGCTSTVSMAQRLYRLTEATAPVGVPGRFRIATARDREMLVSWTEAFAEEALGSALRTDSSEMVERLTRAGALAVWDDGGPVSMASSNRPTPSGIAINLVYTPPEKRGKGYASACVAEISRRQIEAGKSFCTLFTDLANETSNALYQRVGYRPIADFAEIKFS